MEHTSNMIEGWSSPIDPLGRGPSNVVEHAIRRKEVRADVLRAEQEPVKVRVQLRAQRIGPRAVCVSADLLEPVVVRNAERLPYRVRGGHAPERA